MAEPLKTYPALILSLYREYRRMGSSPAEARRDAVDNADWCMAGRQAHTITDPSKRASAYRALWKQSWPN